MAQHNPHEKFLQLWGKERSIGLPKYLALNGSLSALLFFIITSVAEWSGHTFAEVFLGKQALYRLMLSISAGVIIAAIRYYFTERTWRKLMRQQELQRSDQDSSKPA